MRLTLIGNGKMAEALAKGLSNTYTVEVLGRDETKLKDLQTKVENITVKVINDNEDITDKYIILCVKPYALQSVAAKLRGTAGALFSVLAGTTLDTLKSQINAKNYIRTMPNLAASHLKSITTITGDNKTKETAIEIFNKIGKTLWVNSERELDIATAIAGSGPAFLALIAEGLADGGVNAGLQRADSLTLVRGLFEGFAPLLNEQNPSEIKDGVMSPGGTTAAGYTALEEQGVRNAMIKAIEKAFKKAVELGEK